MTDQLRAALRDLCDAVDGQRATSSQRVAEYRALADSPPTVAELLAALPDPPGGRGPGAHRVEWSHDDEPIRASRYGLAGLVVERRLDGEWSRTYLNHADLTQPARLVEVTP